MVKADGVQHALVGEIISRFEKKGFDNPRDKSRVFVVGMMVLGTLMPIVKGDICTEDLGACDDGCNSRCTSAHPGAKAGCDLNNTTPVCRCYFDCPPPTPPPYSKTCKLSLGIWGENCSDKDCNSECAAKYPGPQQGMGATEEFDSKHCVCQINCTESIETKSIGKSIWSVPVLGFWTTDL
ncbi:PREDICTED: defensin, partial [Prunus dulcis]